MKAYISGKIAGDPDYKRKFAEQAKLLELAGYTVLNPAWLPEGMSTADYMRINFAMIDTADVVIMLPDWERSMGAMLEHDHCLYTGKMVMEIHDDLDW